MELLKKKWFIGLIIVLVLFVAVCAIVGKKIKNRLTVNSEYQAVFLTNGQVYFGKLEMEHRWVELTDIYYLQATQPLQQGTEPAQPANNQIQLVKLGSELHGPKDQMFIERDKILFWENLKDDSKVVQKIKESK